MARRGRHQSTDKAGRKTLQKLARIPGVTGVIIGNSMGGKSIGRTKTAGDFKLQSSVAGGFKGVLQTSRGIQEIFVRVNDDQDQVEALIRAAFSGKK